MLHTGHSWVGRYIWYSEEGTGRGRSPPRPLLHVPNVTAHPSTASVPTSYYSTQHYNNLPLESQGLTQYLLSFIDNLMISFHHDHRLLVAYPSDCLYRLQYNTNYWIAGLLSNVSFSSVSFFVYFYHPHSNSVPIGGIVFSSVCLWAWVFVCFLSVNAITLESFQISSRNFYGSKIWSNARMMSIMAAFRCTAVHG